MVAVPREFAQPTCASDAEGRVNGWRVMMGEPILPRKRSEFIVTRTLPRQAEPPPLPQRRADEDITSAAFKAGFNDSNYFARQFRKTFGLSPREYRKREAEK